MHHCKFPNTHMQAVTYVLRHTEEQENTLTLSWCPEQHRSICSRFCWALPPSLISDQCPLTMYSNETISVYCRSEEYGDIAQECACRLSANHPLGWLVCLNLTLRRGMRGPLSTITSSEKAITDKSVKSWMGYQSWNQWSVQTVCMFGWFKDKSKRKKISTCRSITLFQRGISDLQLANMLQWWLLTWSLGPQWESWDVF